MLNISEQRWNQQVDWMKLYDFNGVYYFVLTQGRKGL
jgi:hypothetical protein